jgi:hypothetical protein
MESGSRETLLWRLHFIMGAIAFGLRMPGPLRAFSKGRCDPTDLEILFAQIVPFAVLGFTARKPDAGKMRDSNFQIRN